MRQRGIEISISEKREKQFKAYKLITLLIFD